MEQQPKPTEVEEPLFLDLSNSTPISSILPTQELPETFKDFKNISFFK